VTVKVEIQTAPGVWLDITDDVYQRDSIQISRGRSDEQSQAGPQRMTFTLDNRTGRYSPRNPLSDLYGKIRRNTPVRCVIDGVYGRFYGEVSSWPPKWDPSHSDNYVQVEAYGILRRLGQGQPPVSNALRDWVLAQATLAAYYPLSGGEDTTYSQNIAPGKTGSFRASTGVVFSYGKDLGAAWLGTGMELNDTGGATYYMEGSGNASGSNAAFDFVFQSPNLGVLDVQLWPTLDSYWNLRLNTSADAGTFQVSYYDDIIGLWTDTAFGPVAALQDTNLHTCRFELFNNGQSYIVYIDGQSLFTNGNGSIPAQTNVPMFRFHYDRFSPQTVMNMAHLALWADNTYSNMPTAADYYSAAFAHAGEDAINRMTRLATDGDLLFGVNGDPNEAAIMGPQYTETRLAQFRDAEATDMGILYEDTVTSALMYKSRSYLYNNTPAFTLDYSAGHVSPPLEPVDDDQATRNDVTATRRDGGSARYTVDTGPMSTLDPPDGVGRYDTEVTVNVQTDGMLVDVAAWVANLGTLDKARWPSVTVNLSSPNLSSTLKGQIKNAEIGDWFVIKNMRNAYVYDDVYLIIVGYSETIEQFVHIVTFVCMPADPYTVGAWSTSASSGTFRWDTGGSSLNSSATSTATSLSVATSTGNALWTTDSNAFPFDVSIAGERVTVTNITGASSPQTFTVTRSVNSVVKAQSSGADVRLWDTPRWAL
jgi:hypothetical protein